MTDDTTRTIPPAREITRDNATVMFVDPLGAKPSMPYDDGEDDPRYEYESFGTVDGRVFRIPLRMTSGS